MKGEQYKDYYITAVYGLVGWTVQLEHLPTKGVDAVHNGFTTADHAINSAKAAIDKTAKGGSDADND